MATAKFDRKEVDKLVGKEIDDDTYRNKIPMMGIPVEGFDENEVEIEVFPNRPDLFSVEGFARSLRQYLFDEKPKSYGVKVSNIKLNVEEVPSRPHVVAAVVRNIEVTDSLIKSLMQFQEKIHNTFGRRREKISIGIHDLDKVEAPFTYKKVNGDDTSFVPLDMDFDMTPEDVIKKHPKGRAFSHLIKPNEYPLIVDKNNKVLSLPPIINGELTRVTTDTKNIFIDITGTNPFYLEQALNLTVTIFTERGAEIETVLVNGKEYPNLDDKKVKIDTSYVNKLLDLDLKENELKPLLNKMGLDIDKGEVIIPPYRTDILHEMDLVEDIAIGFGYDNFEAKIPKVPTVAFRNKKKEYSNRIKEVLIGMGFQEVITTILTNPNDHYTKMNTNTEESSEIENPATQDYTICRKYLLPLLIKTFTENQHRAYPQKIFEVGDTISPDGKQRLKLSVGICNTNVGYEDITGILKALMDNLNINFSIESTSHFSFLQGRTGKIIVNEKEVGIIGEITPRVLEKWELDNPVVAFEIDIEKILSDK